MKWPALLALLVGLAALGVMVWAGRVEAQSTLGVPTIGIITATTNTLTVPWTAPSDNGGAPISAYDLQYIRTDADEGVAANWTVVEAWTSGGGTLEYALTDLPDGVQFDVQVRAENAGGDIGGWSATVTGATTDHGGTSSSATLLTLGGSAIGRIEPTTDEDVFSIVLVADAELWIYTTGSLDTVGELLDASNTVLKEADSGTLLDSPNGFEFREELDAGTYYVRVSSFEERKAGSYRIHVLTFTDPGDTFETATEVTLDSATPGRIGPIGGNSGGDADYFKLVLTAATDIWVMAFGTNETEDEPLDSEGRLYGSDKAVSTGTTTASSSATKKGSCSGSGWMRARTTSGSMATTGGMSARIPSTYERRPNPAARPPPPPLSPCACRRPAESARARTGTSSASPSRPIRTCSSTP